VDPKRSAFSGHHVTAKASRLGKVIAGIAVFIAAGIGLALVAIVFAEHPAAMVWLKLALATILPFGISVREFKPRWKRSSFWAVVGGLLVLHLAVYSAVLARISELELVGFLIIGFVEMRMIVA
jgi:hypothetical protein